MNVCRHGILRLLLVGVILVSAHGNAAEAPYDPLSGTVRGDPEMIDLNVAQPESSPGYPGIEYGLLGRISS